MPPMHLFIVSEHTLPIHLKYGFAGVRKPDDCSWANVTISPSGDRSQASLYADVCRVHRGDEVLFYLETPQHDLGREGGRFLGLFEVTSVHPFYEPGGRYLKELLDMPLVYRLLIQPKEIFSQGVTEWQLMDEMTDFRSVHDIPWTLIYRKMEGRRGCTPLLPHEADNIRKMLDLRNAGQRIPPKDVAFHSGRICLTSDGETASYSGASTNFESISPYLSRLIKQNSRKWELHLQAYLMQEIGRNQTMTEILFPNLKLTWLGNEVYAGAGRQSIDILAFAENACNQFIHLIELKSGAATPEAAAQINRYIKWVKAHIPNVSVHQIIPTVIAPTVEDAFHESIRRFLQGHGITHYRVIRVDESLALEPRIHTAF